MDLLGGYGSSSEDEDEDEERAQNASAVAIAAPSTNGPIERPTKPNTPSKQQQIQGRINRKGRKILSLASVLPQHIFDQLTKSQVQGDASDDDDGDYYRVVDDTTSAERGPKRQKGSSSTQLQMQKEGLSSLLSDLQKTAPAAFPHSSSTSSSKPAPLQKEPKRMGTAFLESTVVVETTKRNTTVRDIHAEQTDDAKPAPSGTGKEPATLVPADRKPLTPALAAVPPTAITQPAQVSATPGFSRITPAPGMTSRAAAPPISKSPAPTRAGASGVPLAAAPPAATITTDDRPPRKRSRKELERALRQGNLAAALESDANFTASLQQAPPDAFVPEPETYAVPEHGIRVVPTAMYDPSAGQAVQSASGKGRGKNQIHHLMASAANLELQRARGLGGNAGNKTHRANAKQKYGW